MKLKINVGTNPAKGPQIPISNKARRFGIRGDMAITAPRVPICDIGKGMKNGSVAGTL